jgi:hypothetical protein
LRPPKWPERAIAYFMIGMTAATLLIRWRDASA